MSRHFVRFYAGPAVMLQQDMIVDVGDPRLGLPRVKITNRTASTASGQSPITGLQFDFELDAGNLEEAAVVAQNVCEYVLVSCSLLTSVGIPRARLEIVCDVDPDQSDHPFVQVTQLPVPEASRRWAHSPYVQEILQALDRVPKGQRRLLVERSLGLYRRAIQPDDLLESFMLLFIAMDALDYPLGESIGRIADAKQTLRGVSKFFSERPQGLVELSRCKKLRNGFAHGKPDVGYMVSEALELTPKLRKALVDAYCRLLAILPRDTMMLNPIRLPEEMSFRFSTSLHQTEPGPLGIGSNPPQFSPELKELRASIDTDHQTKVQGLITMHGRFAPYVRTGPVKLEVSGQELGSLAAEITFLGEHEH